MNELKDSMTVADVAAALGVSTQRVWQLTKQGLLEFVETPLGRLYAPADVNRLKKEREERAAQKKSGAPAGTGTPTGASTVPAKSA